MRGHQGPDFAKLLAEFLGLTRRSARHYRASLVVAVEALGYTDPADFDWAAFSATHARLIRAWLNGNRAPKTKGRILSVLRTWLKYLSRPEVGVLDAARWVHEISPALSLSAPPSGEWVRPGDPEAARCALRKHAPRDPRAACDLAILHLHQALGGRQRMVADLEWTDIDLGRRSVAARDDREGLKTVRLSPTAAGDLALWHDHHPTGPVICPVRKNGAVLHRFGVTTSAIGSRIRKILGTAKWIGPPAARG